jgi:two-component system response regulator FlrC
MRSEIREFNAAETNTVESFKNQAPVAANATPNNIALRTVDRTMSDLMALAETVSKSKASVLLLGEFGTGKRTLAKFIHEKSTRASRPLLVMNCRETAIGDQEPMFAQLSKEAIGSTLLFAEIWKLSQPCQIKLLELIQAGIDIRILATSSRSLSNLVKAGEFREELYYRLNVVNMKVPNLESRIGEVEFLATTFVRKWGKVHGREMTISPEAVLLLNSHRWPGNIRELESTCERAILLSTGNEVRARDIQIQAAPESRQASASSSETSWKPGRTLDEIERNVILEALKHFDSNRTHTAKALGISIRTLRNKLAEFRVMGIKV